MHVTLVASSGTQDDPFYFPELLAGFIQGLKSQDGTYSIAISEGFNPDDLSPGAGVVFVLTRDEDHSLIEAVHAKGHPVIAVNSYRGEQAIAGVRMDDARGIQLGVSHLVSLGHTKIGFVAGDPGNPDAIDRLRGFQTAATQHGIAADYVAGHGFNAVAGYIAAWKLLTEQTLTALVCAGDLSAAGAIEAARDAGLSVPVDVSVVGFGDFSAISVFPQLTTVNQGRFDIGCMATQMVHRVAAGEAVKDVVFEGELIVRDSTIRNFAPTLAGAAGRSPRSKVPSSLTTLSGMNLLKAQMTHGWTIDDLYPVHFDGNTARATRTVDVLAHLVFPIDNVAAFEADVYMWNAPRECVSFWVSSDDGGAYVPVPISYTQKVLTTEIWGVYRIANAQPLSAGSTHLKIVFQPTGNNWDPQLTELRFFSVSR